MSSSSSKTRTKAETAFLDLHLASLYREEGRGIDLPESAVSPASGGPTLSSRSNDVQEMFKLIQEDQDRVLFVQRSLQRSEELKEEMGTILGSFEERLQDLESVMLPIHKLTQSLTRAHDNIDLTLGQIGTVLQMLEVADVCEQRVSNPRGDIEEYCSIVDRVAEAIAFFNAHRSFKVSDKALSRQKALLARALDNMAEQVDYWLARYENPIDPSKLPDPLLPDTDINPIPEKERGWLEKLCGRLYEHRSLGFLRSYKDSRSRFVLQTLMRMSPRDIVREDEKIAYATGTTYVRGSHKVIRFIHVFVKLIETEKKLALQLLSPNIRQTTFLGVIEEAVDLFSDTLRNIVRRKRTAAERMTTIFAIYDILNVVQSVLPSLKSAMAMDIHHSTSPQAQVDELGMGMGVGIGADLDGGDSGEGGGGSMGGGEGANLSLSDSLLSLSAPSLPSTGAGSGAGTSVGVAVASSRVHVHAVEVIQSLYNTIVEIVKKSFIEVVDDVRNHSLKMLPGDGTIHEITTSTLSYLRQLVEYRECIMGFLPDSHSASFSKDKDKDKDDQSRSNQKQKQQEPPLPLRSLTTEISLLSHGSVSNSSNNSSSNSSDRLFELVVRILDSLWSNLDAKSRGYKDQTLSVIFLLNNIHYIIKNIRRSSLSNIITASILANYDKLLKRERDNVGRCAWSGVLQHVLDHNRGLSERVHALSRTKPSLNKSDREAIKAKFAGFNTAFDELRKKQSRYVIPDAELSNTLQTDAIELLVPLYKNMMDIYGKVDFTKYREKYIKHTVEEFQKLLNGFFSSSSHR